MKIRLTQPQVELDAWAELGNNKIDLILKCSRFRKLTEIRTPTILCTAITMMAREHWPVVARPPYLCFHWSVLFAFLRPHSPNGVLGF